MADLYRAWCSLAAGLAVAVELATLLAGAGLIAYGAGQAYPPAGPLTGGVLLIVGVILRARGADVGR